MMHSAAAQQQKPPQPQAGKQSNHGTVTKLLENFGFIDDSIFFPLSAVNGAKVNVGDKVYYECTYSQNLPFKWNATLVRMVSSSGAGGPFESKQPQQPPPSANPTQHPPYQQHHHAPPPHHHQPPPHQQQQQQPGNYSIPPPNMYQSNAPPSGPNSGPQPPPPQPNSNYYQQQPPPQQQQQTKLPPPFGNPTSYNNYSGPPGGLPQQQQQQQPPPGQQQPPPQQSAPPPQQQQSQPPPQAAPFPDFAKVQQAVAAAAQLAQLYAPTGNQAGGQNPNQAPPGSVGPSGPTNSASAQSVHNNNASSRGPPPPQSTGSNSSNASSQYGQLQYTSTPGSAFISTPPQFPGQTGGPKMGGLPPPHQGRGGGPMGRNWDPREERFDPRRQAGGPGREDPRGGGSRFGPPPSDMGGPPRGPGPNAGGPPHKSRFQDNDRFGPPNSMNDGRFNAPNFGQPEPSIFGRQPPPQQQQPPQQSAGRDEFGREIRKEQESRFRDNSRDNKEPFSRDRDSRDNRDKDHRDHSREKPREVSRDRDRRDRPDFKSRSRKRSISPVNSIASSQGHSTRSIPNSGTSSKRRSDPCNLPKSSILRNRFNPNDLKSRLPGSIHVPSDLKEVFYNVDMDLDLLYIPKPILFKITPIESSTSKSKEKENKSSSKDTAKSSKPAGTKPSSKEDVKGDKNSSKPVDTENKPAEKAADASQKTTNVEEKKESTGAAVSAETNEKVEEKKTVEDKEENAEPKKMEIDEDASSANVVSEEEIKTDSDAKPSTETKEATKDTSEKSEPNKDKDSDKKAAVEEHKSNSQGKSSSSKTETLKEPGTKSHKFNVKVLLISLPILSEIYERIFGADFDGTGTAGSGVSSKSRGTHFNKIFSLLVTRNSSDGYSLIGGKFVPEMDGFLSGTTEPNLVATAIRVVFEQTGLNLSSCRQWKVFSTFVYNRDTTLDPQQGSYEVTKIYMPDIWSSFESIYAPYRSLLGESATNETPKEKSEEKTETKEETVPISIQNNNAEDSQPMEVEPTTKKEEATADSPADNNDHEDSLKPNKNKDYLQNIMRNMNEMKVADLKSECENLGIKLETRMRKDQLAQRLREHVEAMLVNLANPDPVIDNEGDKTTVMDCTIDRTVPDLVIDSSMISENGDEKSAVEELKDQSEVASEGTTKRKLSTTEIAAPVIADNDKKSSEDDTETSAKKAKLNIESVKSDSEPVTLFATPSNIKVKGNLSILTLSNALNPHRFDQFELVIVAELLRDSLVAHFARYIFTSLLHNNQLQQTPAVPTEKQRVIPVNYVHLAFSFFDKNHCGYINLDDLTNLLNATGYPLSKKVANSLLSGSSSSDQKICYRDFQPPTTNLIDRTTQYPSVGISSALPSSISSTSCEQSLQNGPTSTSSTGPLIIERNCTQYNVDELIKQSEADQKVKVRLNETLANCTIKNAQLEQVITELETKQKKMSAATGRQNDELCTIKRERDQLKSKYDQLRRAIEKSQSLFSDVLRQHQPAPVPQTNTSTIIPPVADKKDTPPPPVVTPSKAN